MSRPLPALLLAAFALAGCDMATTEAALNDLTWDRVTADVARASEESFTELPFTRGVIAVVTSEQGQFSSFRLYPCQSGAAVCLNSPQGPASTVQRTNAHYIVQGTGGRTFFLRPGGGGTLRTPQGDTPLAWNAYINGVPAWPEPTFPYTPWITQVAPGPNP
jgi:hypothetical protein